MLASSSPRRKEILRSIGLQFEVIESHFDEDSVEKEYEPYYLAKFLAFEKAKDVFTRFNQCIVVGADTMVIFNGEVYGKPKDKEDARRMLKNLSGNVHEVVTGVAILAKDGRFAIDSEITKVYFNELSEDDIDAYISTGEYKGKAGGYGIQGRGAVLVKKIEGSYTNVVGLPIEVLCRMFQKIDESIYESWKTQAI